MSEKNGEVMRLTSVDCLTLRYGARSALRKRTRRQYWDGGVPVQWPSIWEYQRQPFSVSGQNDEVGNEVGNCHSKYVLILILRKCSGAWRGADASRCPARGAAHAHPSLPARLANDRWFHLRADQARTFAVISATRRPNARAMARSSGFGCNSPCPPAIVVAPYGVPPRASVCSIPSTE
jgi:hypothetical protein